MPIKEWISYGLRWSVLGSLTGILAGSASAAFLLVLEGVTSFREGHEVLLFFLPVGGLLVGGLYHLYGGRIERGNDLIIDEIHDPKAVIPLKMAPMILLGTLITHLFGGSAGREGTAVQMGGAIADQLSKPFHLSPRERRTLLMAGMSGGFGSVFGVPFAGTIFGVEVLRSGRVHWRTVLECALASFVAHFTCLFWGVKHTHYAVPQDLQLGLSTFAWVIAAGVAFGLCARAFSLCTHGLSSLYKRIRFAPLRPVLGGCWVSLCFFFLGNARYAGLGVPIIQSSLTEVMPRWDFAGKFALTVFTLGAGFKGGEVTPLLFIGTTLGNALSGIIPLHFSSLAALGFVGVFAGAANTPWACTLMAMELFGPQVGIFAAVACWVSFIFSGRAGIYHAQR